MKTEALYLEVYRQILNDIKTGVFARNQPLPAERVLCDKYHVSRYTLRTALDLLNQAEVIYTMPGAGTFIQPFSDPAAHTILFLQQHAEKGQHHDLESCCQLRNAPGR